MSFNFGKRIFSIAIILLLISCNAQATLTDGLVAHWSFDNDSGGIVTDSSGNGNDATAYNDYEYVDGQFSNAIRLVGSGHTGLNGGHVLLPFIPLNESPAFTISMWVNHQGYTGSFGHGEGFISSGISGQGDTIEIGYAGDFPGDTVYWRAGDSLVSIPYSNFENSWQNLVLHCENGILTGYLNGQFAGETIYELNNVYAIAGLGVHWFSEGESNRFIGMMDDIGIWNRALTQSEIEYLSQNPIPEPATLLLLGLGGLTLRSKCRAK